MNGFIRKIKNYSWGLLAFALLFIAGGICLIVFPEDALPTAVLITGIFTAVYSVFKASMILSDKRRDIVFFFRLMGALLSLFCALFLIIKRENAIELLSLFVGVLVMTDGSFKLHTAIMSKRYRVFSWWLLLSVSVVVILLGLCLIRWTPESIKGCSVLIGFALILDGIQNVFATYYSPAVEKRIADSDSEKGDTSACRNVPALKTTDGKDAPDGKTNETQNAE